MIFHDYCCCAGLGADGYAAVFGAWVGADLLAHLSSREVAA